MDTNIDLKQWLKHSIENDYKEILLDFRYSKDFIENLYITEVLT